MEFVRTSSGRYATQVTAELRAMLAEAGVKAKPVAGKYFLTADEYDRVMALIAPPVEEVTTPEPLGTLEVPPAIEDLPAGHYQFRVINSHASGIPIQLQIVGGEFDGRIVSSGIPAESNKTLDGKLRKSNVDSPVKKVFEICETMYAQNARRKDIVQACVDAGIAYYTARTQVQVWLSTKKAEVALNQK